MKPWCAEGNVPTASNLNLYRGGSSHVGWHCDNEPLLGERGEPKLILSVSYGTQALFKWRGKSCSDGDDGSCWLDHCDILVMDGQGQDEFLHCTDRTTSEAGDGEKETCDGRCQNPDGSAVGEAAQLKKARAALRKTEVET